MAALIIEHIKKEKLDELVDVGYISHEAAEQILADALGIFKRQILKNELNHMGKRDFKKLMEKTPAPTRSRHNRKHVKEGWSDE